MFMSLSERVQGSLIRNNAFSNPLLTPDLRNPLQKTFRLLPTGILKGGKMDIMVGFPKTLKPPKLNPKDQLFQPISTQTKPKPYLESTHSQIKINP